jgi:hypothetical protein
MLLRTIIVFVALLGLEGCELLLKNGVFACGQPSDCPTGYFCWSSDNRCYDSEEPSCEPKSCEQVVAEFESIGITIECGSLPDGCDGSIDCGDCPEGSVCGANGQNFVCGCEEVTCATARSGGAQCGEVPARCGGPDDTIDCGECAGEKVCSETNQCVCPPGADCDDGCEQTYPCIVNDCSPPGGLPNGCGSKTECPPCAGDAQCTLTEDLRYECVDDCTCEAKGIECGEPTICGERTPCGTCEGNGFGEGYRCEAGRCVCDDAFEVNDSLATAALLCGPEIGGVNCVQEAWSVEVQASLHAEGDVDFYAIETLDVGTPIIAKAYDAKSKRRLAMTYLCPDGWSGLQGCSGSVETIKGVEFCVTEEDAVAIARWCPGSSGSSLGVLLVGVEPIEFRGGCDDYGLRIIATYGQDLEIF